MYHRNTVLAALALLCGGAIACGSVRDVGTGVSGASTTTCTTCHGGQDNHTGAPPFDLRGGTDPSLPSVGAHTAHVTAGAVAGAFDCDACHVKPSSIQSPGHLDGVVQISFNALATASGTLSAHYDRTTFSCSTVYCHGNFPGGNPNNAPVWTRGDSQAACGTCHGNPNATPPMLPSGHVDLASGSTAATCNACHGETVKADGTVDVAAGKHVNGTVEFDPIANHPSGWLDPGSASFHGNGISKQNHASCLRCHAVDFPARVTTVVCNGCHALIGDPIP